MGPSELDDPKGEESAAATGDRAALEAMIADLRRSNAELEQFAYVVSHDLREPLRMVSSYAQLLSRRLGPGLDADSAEFLHYITDGARRMEGLIQDVLTFSRVGRCAIPPKAFASRDALDCVLDDLQHLIAETGARVDIGPMPTVVGDRGQIERLFENLVANALKYHRPDAPPCVRIQGEERPDAWTFSVADNGIGIDGADRDRVFMVFERLHGREIPGTGLGLAICKKVVERHGGRIWVESKRNQGSTFFFTLARRDP
ncbi:MAG: sensor histidine kinase [Solirubrobacterales bacterium]